MNQDTPIAFLGGGNMASSLIGGIISSGHRSDCIDVFEPDAARAEALAERFQIRLASDAEHLAERARAIVLAVKPQQMQRAIAPLATHLCEPPPVLISIAAGIRIASLEKWLGRPCPLVRCMPNTPALVHCGATALFANDTASLEDVALAEAILAAVGIAVRVDQEDQLDAVTAISGSGPAYFFRFQELLVEAGINAGLAPDMARQLVAQTALGAARMVSETGREPGQMRAEVTSPGGTTERALQAFEQGGLSDLVQTAVSAASERSRELAEQMDS